MKLLGVIVILVSLYFLKVKLDVYKVQNEGEIVQMSILELPKDCTIKNSSMQLHYKDKRFFKKTKASICQQYKVGDIIPMKYKEGADYALYPTESVVGEFVAIGVFVVVGLTSIILGFRKKMV